MKKIIFILIAYTWMFSLLAAQSARQYVKAGKEFAENNHYKDAISQFSKAIEIDPKDPDLYSLRASTYEKDGNLQLAYDDYIRSLSFDDNSNTRTEAGRIAYLMKQYDNANSNLDIALSKKSFNIEAYEYKIKTLIAQQEFIKAKELSEKSLTIRENAMNYYLNAVVLDNLKQNENAETSYKKAISKEKKLEEAYIGLCDLQIRLNKLDKATETITDLMKIDPKNTDAFIERSKIYIKQLDFANGINDISRAIIVKPDDEQLFFIRGTYYQQFTQYQNAINDFNKVLMIDDKNADAYYQRASCYEQVANYKAAIKDYSVLASLSENDVRARKLLDAAKKRLYELNRESNPPQIFILDPLPHDKQIIDFPKNKNEVRIKGKVKDESDVEYLKINDINIPIVKHDDAYDFDAVVKLDSSEMIAFAASDTYQNVQNIKFSINRTPIDPPKVSITAPYSSDNGEIYIDTNDPNIYVEGKISDESLIKSIMIEGVSASYKIDELNPVFSATANIANKNKITVIATDIYGNTAEKEFALNRQGADAAAESPMGKTWAVFIENSNYQTFASLEGPVKDISLMKAALVKYKINNIIHKKDMTKKDMEKFFSIDLRDLLRSNHVDALMIWYAGHGKFINQTGYWVPIDANRDDEFTYFNINSLKASMQSYSNLTHILVITDACESGPTFYQAMRGTFKESDCSDWKATKFKSSQVFSSAGYELAIDNSQFTKTFANSLVNNPNACISIENIVQKVTVAVTRNNQQKPQFGKIAGLVDEDGTFFFITK